MPVSCIVNLCALIYSNLINYLHLIATKDLIASSSTGSKSKRPSYILPIAGGVGGVILLTVVACIIMLIIARRKYCKGKEQQYIDDQEATTGKFNPVYEDVQESNFIEPPTLGQCGKRDSNTNMDEFPRYDNMMVNPHATIDYETAVPQKPSQEMEEFYLDMKSLATEEPMYDTICEYSKKEDPVYENSKIKCQQRSLPANFKLKTSENVYQ